MSQPRRGEVRIPVQRGAARRHHQDRPLVLQEADGAIVGIAKGHPGARHHVHPCLEGRRDAEVVDGGGDDHQIRPLELRHQFVRGCQRLPLTVGTLPGGREGGIDPGCVHEFRRRPGEIAPDDPSSGTAPREVLDDPIGKGAAHGAFLAATGVDPEDPKRLVLL